MHLNIGKTIAFRVQHFDNWLSYHKIILIFNFLRSYLLNVYLWINSIHNPAKSLCECFILGHLLTIFFETLYLKSKTKYHYFKLHLGKQDQGTKTDWSNLHCIFYTVGKAKKSNLRSKKWGFMFHCIYCYN